MCSKLFDFLSEISLTKRGTLCCLQNQVRAILGKFRTVSDAKRFASRSDINDFSLWTRLKVVGGGDGASLKEDFSDSDDDLDDDLGDLLDDDSDLPDLDDDADLDELL